MVIVLSMSTPRAYDKIVRVIRNFRFKRRFFIKPGGLSGFAPSGTFSGQAGPDRPGRKKFTKPHASPLLAG